MPDDIVPASSPFDAIRHTDDQGEYWTARELMPLLEYQKWQDFNDAIDRAKEDCDRSGRNVEENFTRSRKVSGSRGPGQQDYRLTHYACRLIVMTARTVGDIAAQARTYFSDMVDVAEDALIAEWERRAINSYLSKGYSEEWALARVRDIQARDALTHEWQVRGIQDDEYAILTDQLHMGTFGLSIAEHKAMKDFPITRRGKKVIYRDPLPPAMTMTELALNTLASAVARDLHIARDSQGFRQISGDVGDAGAIAARTRKEIEAATGHPVVSPHNMVKAPDGALWAQLPAPDDSAQTT